MPASDDRLKLPEVHLDPRARAAIGDRLEAAARRRVLRRRAAPAAAAALVLTAAAMLVVWRRPEPPAAALARMRTGPGEFQLLPVGDRAVAFVSERSDVEVLPGPDAAVRVHHGSARFVVSRDPARASFVVRTRSADVAVLGTEFDVVARPDETEVRVVRGEVEVRNALGRRRLWAGEGARARRGEAPRIQLPVRGIVTEAGPVQVVPRRR